jgi:DNA-nicking Smr family endonuclease
VSGRRRRILTRDETALWAQVTLHVAPMPGRKRLDPEPPAPLAAKSAAMPSAGTPIQSAHAASLPTGERKEPAPAPRPAPLAPAKPSAPPLAPLERRLRQRLARGRHPVDAVIDLHGLRQIEAHEALRRFLGRAQAQGAGVVLVVTGKGGGAAEAAGLFEERGVLRRMVPHWLRLPDLRPLVIGFDEAAGHHGGSGALYVRIRRAVGRG